MKKVFNNLLVGKKIMVVLGVLVGVFFISFGIVKMKISQNSNISERLVDLRVPTINASLEILNGINHSLAALRGWMILGKDNFKAEREVAWKDEILVNFDKLKIYSKDWTNPENIERLKLIEGKLDLFKTYQKEIEDISHLDENVPAVDLLLKEAAPQAKILSTEITNIIDIEATLEATTERKKLLGMMADVRGTIGLGLASIRAFLLTGDIKFKKEFEKLWKKNSRRFNDLKRNEYLLNSKQNSSFEKFQKAREIFKVLPKKMFDLRLGSTWNKANSWLGSKAAPVAFSIKKSLSEMIKNQKALLAADVSAGKSAMSSLNFIMLGILAIVFVFTILVSRLLIRSITQPLNQAVEAFKKLGDGDLTTLVTVTSEDELGVMSTSLNNMTQNLQGIFLDLSNSGDSLASNCDYLSTTATSLDENANSLKMGSQQMAAATEELGSSAASMGESATLSEQEVSLQARKGKDISNIIEEVSGRITSSADGVQTLASSVEELSAGTNELRESTNENLKTIEEMTIDLKLVAANMSSVEKETTEAESEIKEVTSDIADMSTKINSVKTFSDENLQMAKETVSSINKINKSVLSINEQAISTSSEINSVAGAVEEMNASFSEIASSTAKASQTANEAQASSKEASIVMKNLEEASLKISEVVKFIVSISDQTGLLALNATIEASRAGEAGKGFAVVAEEVKQLAKSTAVQVQVIQEHVDSIQNLSNKASESLVNIDEVIHGIVTSSTSISTSVEQQVVTNREIEQSMLKINSSASEILTNSGTASKLASEVIQQSQRASDSTAKITENIQEMAKNAQNISGNAKKVAGVVSSVVSRTKETAELVNTLSQRGSTTFKNSTQMANSINEFSENVGVMAKTSGSVSSLMESAKNDLISSAENVKDLSISLEKVSTMSNASKSSALEMSTVTTSVSKEVHYVSEIAITTNSNASEISAVVNKLIGVNSSLKNNLEKFKLPDTVGGEELETVARFLKIEHNLSWDNICDKAGLSGLKIDKEKKYYLDQLHSILDASSKITNKPKNDILAGLKYFEDKPSEVNQENEVIIVKNEEKEHLEQVA